MKAGEVGRKYFLVCKLNIACIRAKGHRTGYKGHLKRAELGLVSIAEGNMGRGGGESRRAPEKLGLQEGCLRACERAARGRKGMCEPALYAGAHLDTLMGKQWLPGSQTFRQKFIFEASGPQKVTHGLAKPGGTCYTL